MPTAPLATARPTTARATALISHLYDETHLAWLETRFPEVRFVPLPKDPPHSEAVASADLILYGGLGKPALSALLKAAPRLRWLHTSSAGFDWVMVPEVAERELTITRSANSLNGPMAEFTLAVILRFVKRLDALEASQRARRWEPTLPLMLRDLTVGVVGAGAIGTRLAELCVPLGMRVIGTKRTPTPQPGFAEVRGAAQLPWLLERSDIVVLACPLTAETRYLMGEEQFRMMKPGSYLINIARGALVREAALTAALEARWIAGACMDAFETEPLPEDSPLWSTPNLLVTPHCSYRSTDIRQNVLDEFAQNLRAFLAGEPLQNTMKHPSLGY